MTVDVPSRRAIAVVALGVALLSGCGGTSSSHGSTPPPATVRGRVTAGPTCPVERVGHPCAPRPVRAVVEVLASARVVARARTRRDGTFALSIAGGSYTLAVRTPHPFPRCTPRNITLAPGSTSTIDLTCDTGLR
jgi:hypothetical protein